MAKIGRNEACPCGSGTKFKRCHIENWPPRAAHSVLDRYELQASLSFLELAKLLRSGLDASAKHAMTIVATVLKRFSETVPFLESQTDQGVHAASAGALILASCYGDDVTSYSDEQIPVAIGAEADRLLTYVRTRLENRFGSSLDQPWLGLLQILCTQGTLQGQHAFQLFRTLHLLELEDFVSGSRVSEYDGLFESAYGCSTAEYLAVVTGMWYVTATAGEFVTKDFVRNSPIAERLRPIAARVLSEHSCKIQDVKRIIDHEFGHHGMDGLVAAFFARYPFVEFREGVYFPAPHPYIRLFAVTSPVFRMLELARNRAAAGDKSHLESPESQRMGARFELLAQALLGETFDQTQIVVEHVLNTSGSQRSSPDLILFEEHGATLIQAKIKRLAREAFFGFDMEALRRDTDKAIAETIQKSIRYLAWLDSAEAERTLTEHARAVRTRLRNAKKLFLLGLLPAMPSVFHIDVFRKMVEAGIQQKLRPHERSWFEKNASRFSGWHVMDSEELAEFVARRGKWSLHHALSEFVSMRAFGKFLDNGEVVAPFRGFVAARGRRLGIDPELPKIDAAVQRFLGWTVEFVFQQSVADYERAAAAAEARPLGS